MTNGSGVDETVRNIVRGVNAKVSHGKRSVLAFVVLSKNRTEELEILKNVPFFKTMTLNTKGENKNIFTQKLNSISERDAFLEKAVAEGRKALIKNTAAKKGVLKASNENDTEVEAEGVQAGKGKAQTA